jgi:phosphate transport system ATP-binding protein
MTNIESRRAEIVPDANGQAAREAKPEAAIGGRAIIVSDLQAYYHGNRAINRVSIDYAANRVTAMIGPSGCGKSTVLRCLNRMHEEIPGARAEGSVKLDELDIYDPTIEVAAVRRAVGMVFQKPNPFPTMSIFDNVAAGVRLTGVNGVNLEERVEQSLVSAGLWDEVKDRLGAPGLGLSGGQQQRLCIARTIATRRIEELIQALKQRYTIVMVTHNMQQAARVADTTAFMLDGEVVEHAATDRIFSNPGDERTERYVTGKFG